MKVGSLNHVVLTVNDLKKSRAFYDALLPALGYRFLSPQSAEAGEHGRDSFGFRAADGLVLFFEQAPESHRNATFDRYRVGLHHLAFDAPDRAFVDAIHQKLVALGATILDPPAEYPQYAATYYAVFFLDPDGIKLEVVHV